MNDEERPKKRVKKEKHRPKRKLVENLELEEMEETEFFEKLNKKP
jgi:hypothetical protein